MAGLGMPGLGMGMMNPLGMLPMMGMGMGISPLAMPFGLGMGMMNPLGMLMGGMSMFGGMF
jgi:hypothetical protein